MLVAAFTTSDMSDSKKAQNLARIRDNQRRSRARRKEYLQELEDRLRDCEQVGIEVSTEIQSAARRVLDENRKLRALLHERGVSDSELVMAISGIDDRSYEQVSAAPSLNALLERRVICNGPTAASSPASPHATTTRGTPHTPAIPPVPRSAALGSNESLSPHSVVSSMGTPPPPFHSMPYPHASVTPVPETRAEDVSYMLYEQPFQHPWSQSSMHPRQQYQISDPASYYNASSCVDAANIIRTMRHDAGPELEAELGCQAPGQHCYVTNSIIFNVMDRYASPQGV